MSALCQAFCAAIAMILVSRGSDRTGERFRRHVLCPVTIGALWAHLRRVFAWECLCRDGRVLVRRGRGPVIDAAGILESANGQAYFGAATAAAGIGAINTIGNTAGYLAPQFMGLLHDASGGYRLPLLVSGCLALAAPILIAASGIRRHVTRPERLDRAVLASDGGNPA